MFEIVKGLILGGGGAYEALGSLYKFLDSTFSGKTLYRILYLLGRQFYLQVVQQPKLVLILFRVALPGFMVLVAPDLVHCALISLHIVCGSLIGFFNGAGMYGYLGCFLVVYLSVQALNKLYNRLPLGDSLRGVTLFCIQFLTHNTAISIAMICSATACSALQGVRESLIMNMFRKLSSQASRTDSRDLFRRLRNLFRIVNGEPVN